LRNVILSLGCSFTDEGFRSSRRELKDAPASVKGPWKMWPQIFKDRLSERDRLPYRLINAGGSGSSMDWAAEKFFENWIKYKDSLKVVLWGGTGYLRFQHFAIDEVTFNLNNYKDNQFHPSPESKSPFDGYTPFGGTADTKKMVQFSRRTSMADSFTGMVEYGCYLASTTKDDAVYLRQARVNHERLVCIKDLCESNDVHFIYYPLFSPFGGGTYEKLGGRRDSLTRGETMNYLYAGSHSAWEDMRASKNFIGIARYGFVWDNWLHSVQNGPDENYLISHNKEYPNADYHPNSKGQELIANEFWKHYEEHF
jgi:hypothetical protein